MENGQFRERILKVSQRTIDGIHLNERNPKQYTDKKQQLVNASLSEFGKVGVLYSYYDDAGVERFFDGNTRKQVDPGGVWYVAETDLSQDEVDDLVMIYDPLAEPVWDAELLNKLLDETAVIDDGLNELLNEVKEVAKYDAMLDELVNQIAGNENGNESKDDIPLPTGVPDTIWPTDNEYGIPLLDITRQADAFDLPIEAWGAKARGTKAGTIHFYTEDYRFGNIWKRPRKVSQAQPVNIVEPNYTIGNDSPMALTIWKTYQKRWLARYWQSLGHRIFVDLNVSTGHDDINLFGVPDGWRAYATRGYTAQLEALDAELNIAKRKAQSESVLFLVYGGSYAVRDWSANNGAVWIVEDADKVKGKFAEV